METNKIPVEPPLTGTDGFDLNQCPFPESCKSDENDLADSVYNTVSSPWDYHMHNY